MKRFWISTGGGLACLFLTILLLHAGSTSIRGRESAVTPAFDLESPDSLDSPGMPAEDVPPSSAVNPDKPSNQPVRSIEPEQFGMTEQIDTQPLERIEARTPLSQPPEPKIERVVLRHPVAVSAGLIRFGDRLLQLDGVAEQAPERVCGDGGDTWPCGMVARTAFRNFLRARALLCDAPNNGWSGTLTSRCTVGDMDPAAWLAENGWAEAPVGSPFGDRIATARREGIGFFGKDPRDKTVGPAPTLPDPTDGQDMDGSVASQDL